MQFVDTNIFIRYLARDYPQKTDACRVLFERAAREESVLTTSESVIAEVVFVLGSKRLYDVPREQIRALLYPLLTIRGLKLINRGAYLRALDLYAASNLDFEDALTIAHMERRRLVELVSYDQGFDKASVAGITRLEP
jgi:uncharacterized protein